MLLDDRIFTTGSLERPQEGCVADNGTVIPHDWMSGEGLQGRFVAFAPDGRQLGKKIEGHGSAVNAICPERISMMEVQAELGVN